MYEWASLGMAGSGELSVRSTDGTDKEGDMASIFVSFCAGEFARERGASTSTASAATMGSGEGDFRLPAGSVHRAEDDAAERVVRCCCYVLLFMAVALRRLRV